MYDKAATFWEDNETKQCKAKSVWKDWLKAAKPSVTSSGTNDTWKGNLGWYF
jgi:hypothetical protein